MAIDDEKRRQTLSINQGLPFPRGLPPRSAVTTPTRIEQPKVPTAGQTAGAGVRAAGSAIDRATQQFSIGTLPPAGAIYQSGNRFSDQRTAGAVPVQQPAQQARSTSAAQPASVPLGQVQPAAPAAPNGITRSGNRFSDQPIANGVPFHPGGRLSVVSDAPPATQRFNTNAVVNADAIAKNRGDVPGSGNISVLPATDYDRQLRAFGAMKDADRADRQAERNWRTQRERDSFNSLQIQRATSAGGIGRPVSAPDLVSDDVGKNGTSSQAEARTRSANAGSAEGQQATAAAVAEAQAQATQLAQQAAMRKQQLQQQLGGAAQGDPRRTAIDQLLVDQGKDPDAGRYMGIDVLGPTDSFGTPTQLRGALDTRSGSILGGGTTATPSVGGQLPEGALVQQNGKTFRIVNGQPVPVENKAR
jgi:hypothetical protein